MQSQKQEQKPMQTQQQPMQTQQQGQPSQSLSQQQGGQMQSQNIDRIQENYLAMADRLHPWRHPFFEDRAMEAFTKIGDAFDILSDSLRRGIFDERGFGGLSDRLISRFVRDPWQDFGNFFEDPFFQESRPSSLTFEQAEKLYNDVSKTHEPNIPLQRPRELLDKLDDFDKMFRHWSRGGNAKTEGRSYEISSITKDGKTVTVTKDSRLNPDGKIKTKVNERIEDAEGHMQSKTWRAKHRLFGETGKKQLSDKSQLQGQEKMDVEPQSQSKLQGQQQQQQPQASQQSMS